MKNTNIYKYLSISGLFDQCQKQVLEGYDDVDPDNAENNDIVGIALVILIPLFIIYFIIWIWALVILIKYWKQLPLVAQVLGVLGVFPRTPFGPVLTLIIVYALKDHSKYPIAHV